MREKGEEPYLSASALIVYGRGKYYGIFGGVKYARLIARKRNREIANELGKMPVKSYHGRK